MIEQINKLIDKRIKSFIKKLDLERRIPAKALGGEVDGYVEVQLVGDQNNRTIKLLNKTGEEISEGDSLWVTYHGKLTSSNAVISQRNGVAKTMLSIDTAVVVAEDQTDTYLVSQDVVNVDVQHRMRVLLGDQNNRIVVNGYVCIPSPYKTDEDFINNLPESIFLGDCLYQTAELPIRDVNGDISSTKTYTFKINSFIYSTEYGERYVFRVNYTGMTSSAQPHSPYNTLPTNFGLVFLVNRIYAPNTSGTGTQTKYGYVTGYAIPIALQGGSPIPQDPSVTSKFKGTAFTCHFASLEEYESAVAIMYRSESEPIS